MGSKMFIYNKNPEFNPATISIAAEVRNVIQNWRKENSLPIDFHVPTLYVWFKEPIIKSALVEGRCEATSHIHVFEICQVDKVEFVEPFGFDEISNYDFVCWSPLGGTIGKGNVLADVKCKIKGGQNLIKTAIEKKAYNEW